MPHRPVDITLDNIMNAIVSHAVRSPAKYVVPYDCEWPSICFSATEDESYVYWQPRRQCDNNHFSGVEQALELSLHRDIITYYTRWYSLNLPITLPYGSCEMLQVISIKDFVLLQENLIGHLLMQQQLALEPTIFIGVVENSEIIISVNNQSGEVGLELPGKPAHKVIAQNIGEFLESIATEF